MVPLVFRFPIALFNEMSWLLLVGGRCEPSGLGVFLALLCLAVYSPLDANRYCAQVHTQAYVESVQDLALSLSTVSPQATHLDPWWPLQSMTMQIRDDPKVRRLPHRFAYAKPTKSVS